VALYPIGGAINQAKSGKANNYSWNILLSLWEMCGYPIDDIFSIIEKIKK
jgi:hypothetical protein